MRRGLDSGAGWSSWAGSGSRSGSGIQTEDDAAAHTRGRGMLLNLRGYRREEEEEEEEEGKALVGREGGGLGTTAAAAMLVVLGLEGDACQARWWLKCC
jgi:hypothetical protein